MNILSGGAAQGLVASLATNFKTRTGFGIAGEFGAAYALVEPYFSALFLRTDLLRHIALFVTLPDWRR